MCVCVCVCVFLLYLQPYLTKLAAPHVYVQLVALGVAIRMLLCNSCVHTCCFTGVVCALGGMLWRLRWEF